MSETRICQVPDVAAGDFETSGNIASALANCLCELAIHFRAARGGVGLSHREVSTWMERQLSQP